MMSGASNVVGRRPGKRFRNVSETASQSSWGSELNGNSDLEDADGSLRGNSKSVSRAKRPRQHEEDFKMFSSSDEEGSTVASSDLSRGKRPKCFSRNAVIARQNRLKKKQYVQELENEIQLLRRDNSKLKTSLDGYSKDMDVVRKENLYLRNVLANTREIGRLLRAVNSCAGLPVSSSLTEDTRNKKPDGVTSPPGSRHHISPTDYLERVNPVCDLPPRTPSSESLFEPNARIQKDFPITAGDVSLSVSAPEDDDLDLLSMKNTSVFDVSLSDCSFDDHDYLAPDSLIDWLDGDEALPNVGVCLHVANKKVSLEFCASCNESALSSWNEGILV